MLQIASIHLSDIRFKDFTRFYKDYSKEPFSFLVNNTTFPSDNHQNLGRTYYKMTVSGKVKTIDHKMEKNIAQYNLDRQAPKISILSLRNIGKYEPLTAKDVQPGKYLLEKKRNCKETILINVGSEYDPENSFLDDWDEYIVVLKDEGKRTDISAIPLPKGYEKEARELKGLTR